MKYFLFSALVCLFSQTILAQPVNDNACDATLLTVDSSCSGTPYTTALATAQGDEPMSCGSQTNSVWFKFTAPASGAIRIISSGSTVRKSLYAVGDCSNFSTYTWLDCTRFGDDIWHSGLTAGTEYWIRVTSTSSTATFCMSVQDVPSRPANDDVCSATLIELDSACSGNIYTNVNATRQTGEPTSCSNEGQTVWFKFTAPPSGAVRVSMNNESLATSIYAVTDSCGDFNNFTELACLWFGDALEASGLTPDSTYYIQSTSLFEEVGAFCLTVETVLPPTNDSAYAAILLNVDGECNDAPYSLTGATYEVDEPDSCFSSPFTAWFKFVVPSGGAVEVDVWSSSFWSVANVLTADDSGDFSTYATIGCAGYNGPSQLFGLTAGDTVFIQINSYDGYTGGYCVAVDTLFQWFADFDGDGYGDPNNDFWATYQQYGYAADSTDCNDNSASIYPDATEICDGYDNNCDGQIDEGVGSYFFADMDGDGFGNAALDTLMCSGIIGFVADSTDCNDSDSTIFPNAPELCDGLDNDCDGQTDEDTPTWYADLDGDGFGNANLDTLACDPGTGWVLDSTDCDDAHAAAHPGAAEICDNLDNDCNGQTDEGLLQTFYADADGDGFGNPAADSTTCATTLTGYVADNTDCNDANASAHPGGTEICDLVDNDCDGTIDEGFDVFTYYADADGDGFGNPASTILACTSPPGYVYLALDCDDTNPAIHYGAAEICDGLDNDCDGQIDDGALLYFYLDADADGYGEGFGYSQNFVLACSQPAGYAPVYGDCDDSNPAIHPGAMEVCNGLDDDCDGGTDEGVGQFFYLDNDGDGYGNGNIWQFACTAPSGYVADGNDCNDTNPNIHPGKPETCDGIDQNCNGQTDEGLTQTFYPDADGDGYGNLYLAQTACTVPAGFILIGGDCDDSNANIHPGATEICNGLDDDCDGQIDEGVPTGSNTFYADADGDGYGNAASTTLACTAPAGFVANSLDCDDSNANVHPGGLEICGNGLDDNCDGSVDVNPPFVTISPAQPLICGSGNTTLTASIGGSATYAWSNGPTTASNTVSPTVNTTYTVTVTLANTQCTATASRTVTISTDQAIGVFGSRAPANGSVNVAANPAVFTWSPVPNAEYFDLFVWPAAQPRPSYPMASNLTAFSSNLTLANGTTYKWQLRAFNDCHWAWSDTMILTTIQLPDLVVPSITAPASASYGQTIAVSWEVQNIGQGGTGPKIWTEKLFLSADTTTTRSDALAFSQTSLNYLNPSETYTQTRNIYLPTGYLGAYYLVVQTGIGLNETSKTNNVRYIPFTVTIPPLPDLQIESVGAPTAAFGGDNISISAVVKNTGGLNVSRDWTDRIYLSDDTTFNPATATLLATRSAGGANLILNPDSSYAFVQTVQLPHSTFGQKWIHVVADATNAKLELSENNNVSTTAQAIQITLLPPVDLQPTALTLPASATSGQSIFVMATIHNNGAASYTSETVWTDYFYLSQNTTWDNSDTPIGFALHDNGISAGATYMIEAACELPAGVFGTYYVLVKADDGNDVFEYIFENNNVLASATPLNIALAPSPDLKVTSVLPSANAMTEQQAYTLSWTTKNQGNAPASGQLSEVIYFSQNPTWDGTNYSDIVEINRHQRTINLAAVDSVSYSSNFILPNLPAGGTWYAYLRTDANNNHFEANGGEGNNLTRSAAITVTERFADLQVTAFTAPATALSGGACAVNWSVKNAGQVFTGLNGWFDFVFLSTDTTWSSNDILLGNKERASGLAPDSSYAHVQQFGLPNGLNGNFYLLLRVANGSSSALNDANAANNFAAIPISINLAPSPDLVVTSLSMPSPVFAGQPYWAHFSVKNQGTATVNNVMVSDRLFFAEILNQPTSLSLGYRAAQRSLAPQASYSDSVLITVPSYANGYFYLTMRTDNQNTVYEHNGETNNNYVGTQTGQPNGSQQAIVVLPSTDSEVNLVVTEVSAPDSAMLGDWTSVQFEIKNTGQTAALGTVRDMDYFSKDGIFNAATDRLQKAQDIYLNLAPGDSTTHTLSAPLLTFEPGDHRAVARTNTSITLAESNPNDNTALATAQTHVGVRSLILETPTVFSLNQDAWHYYQFTVSADLDVLVTLKALSGLNNGRLFIGHERVPTPNDFDFTDDEANGTRTAIIPTCAAGTYIVLAQVLAPFETQPQTELLVRALPFSVVSANPDHLGRGRVTSTVVGAGFTETTTTWALRQGNTTVATGTAGQFFNSMKMKVRWDLTNVPAGTYDLVASKPDGQTAVLAGGIVVEEAKHPQLTIVKNLPNLMRTDRGATWSFSFINTGNLDIDVAECPFFTTSNMTITAFNKSSNIMSRDEFFPEVLQQSAVEERDGFYRIMMWMKDIQPGEAGYFSLKLKGFPVGSIPIRMAAIPYTKTQFLKKQAYIHELQRQMILGDPTRFANRPELLSLAENQSGYRDSMLLPYVIAGFANMADIAAMDFGLGSFAFSPTGTEGKAIYQNTSFEPGAAYLWQISLDKAQGGAAGKKLGWDLVHAKGTINVTATADNPFVVAVFSKNPCTEGFDYLTTWEPWHDYRWPIAVADGGWQNFSTDKVKIESTAFAEVNKLYGGHFQLELSGDTLYLHFVHRERLPGEPGCNGGLGLCGYPGGNGGDGGEGAPGGKGGDGENGNSYGPPSPGGKGGNGGQQALGGAGGKGGNGAVGQNGAAGGAGGKGGAASDQNRGGTANRGDGGAAGDGGPGGDGGDGGYGANGGSGGDGGTGGDMLDGGVPEGNGGAGGDGGNGGTNGTGGDPGDGGIGDTSGADGNPGVPGPPGPPSPPSEPEPAGGGGGCKNKRLWAAAKCGFSIGACVLEISGCTAGTVVTAGLAAPCYAFAGVGCAMGIVDDCGGLIADDCGEGLLGPAPCATGFGTAGGSLAIASKAGKLAKFGGVVTAVGFLLDCVPFEPNNDEPNNPNKNNDKDPNDPFDYDDVDAIFANDPNDIAGPVGIDSIRWVSKLDTLNFHVNFENDSATATAAAQRVTVRVPLHAKLNPFSLRIGKFGFAGMTFDVPANKLNYTKVLHTADSLGVDVEVTAGLDIVNNEAFWTFQAIDPLTGLPPALPELGMLPVNDSLGRGQGFVEYSILANSATATGDTATAKAEIVFDINDPILTNIWENTFDAVAPSSTLGVLAPTQHARVFPITFSGEDDAGGSGLSFFELFVSENGGPFKRYGERTSDTINFIGNFGSSYEFFTRATDRTGNREAAKSSGSITQIVGMTATVAVHKPSCPGAASGSATVNRTGGQAPFQYTWSAGGAGNTDTASGLAPGNYTVTVSDSNLPPQLLELEFEVLDTVDLTKPTAVCQNLTQNLQASDTLAHFSSLSIADGSADNCGAVMISPSTFDFGCGELGPHTVTLTVTDISGNTATCSATLTVTDANGLCNPDADGDGYSLSNDCDDGNAAIHPGIAENCGLVGIPGVDDDCDGTIDEDLTPPTITCPASQALKTGDDGGADCEVTVTYTAPTFSDNCDGTGTATWVSGPTSGTSLNVSGSPYTVVYTKIDAAGNTVATNCSFTVTVQDDTKPTLANCPSNILLKTGDDGGADCEVTVTYTAPTFSDNCDGTGTATWVSGPTSGTSLNVSGSPYTVVYTKTDAAGNTVATNCSFTVTVQDDTKPTLANCPSNILLKTGDDGGADCEVTVTYSAPTFSDNCDGTGTATWVSGPTSGTSLNVSGSPYTVVYTKTDAAGNAVATDCSFTVTVQDDTKPTIANCPSNILLKTGDDGGADCEVTVTYTTPTFADNCEGTGAATYVSGPTSGTSLNVSGSPYTVVYTYTDLAGNAVAANCSFTVTVQDDTKPTLANCPSNILLKTGDDGGADCEVTVTYTAPTFSDNCDGTGTATWVSGPTSGTSLNVSGSPYTVVYTKTDAAGNTVATNCSFTVTVQDDTKPTLANPLVDCSSLNITGVNKCLNTATAFNAMTLESAVAALYKDNCTVPTATLTSTTPGDGNTNCSWSFTYTYTISDGIPANNVTCTVTRSGSDQTIPVITLTGSNTVEICQYATYTDAGATAMDNCGGNITANIVPNNPVNTAVPNTYTVTYNVTDACTNAAIQVTRTVIVKPTPTASVTGNVLVCIGASIPLNGNPVGGFGTYSTHTWSQTGGAGAVSITNNNDGSASILGITAGSVTLQYTVTDDKTCSGTAMYNITVVDCGGIAIINNRQPGDPCSCNNDQSANGAQDGTFGESVSVLPTTNQETWTVVAVGRLAASGGLPTGIAIGNTLTYNAGGFHEISFQHVDDAGYTMIVEGPNSTVGTPGNPALGNSQLTVSNICQYPVIAFDPTLPDNVCLSSAPIALTVSEANSFVGVTTYTVNGNAATHFDPSPPLTPPGPYPVVANYTGTFAGNSSLNPAAPAFPGCMTSIADQIGIYTAPTVSCPGPVTLTTNSDDNGDCDAEYLLTHPDIGTMCATDLVISFTNGAPAPPYLPSGSSVTPSGFDTYAFPAGQTIVTYTVTDAANDVTSCFFTVTVVDNEDPTISCPGPTTVQCTSLVPAPSPASVGASDNCGIVLKEHWYTTQPYNVQCLNKFQLTRYYRAYDAEGNSATCLQVITVFDNTLPNFTFVPPNVTVQCNSVPAVGTPIASDNCNGTVNIAYNGQTRVDGSCTDSYVLTRQWTATDACGNTRTATQRITVIDTQKPAFVTVPANVTVQCDAIPAVASPTATDNCDASVVISYIGQTKTNGVCANSFTYIRRWVASDNCNNTVSISQRIVVVDNGKPAITVPANVTIACTDPVPAVGAPSATDNCGGTVTIVYLGQSTINATCPGNYQINRTWRATDVCGNSTAATQTITVRDNSAPVFTSVPNNVTIQCHQTPPATGNPVATDNCGGPVSITYLGQVRTDGNCLYKYTLTRTWRATDQCGNSTSTAQVITVRDTQAPTFTNPPANLTVVCAPDFVPPPVTPNATDNCGTPTVTLVQTQSPGNCSTGYTVTRTWTATDQCGNPKVHVQTITVLPTPFAPPAADRDQKPLKTQNALLRQSFGEQAKLKTVQLTPNPTIDRVLIGLGDFAGETVAVSIYSNLGELIWERKVEAVADMKLPVNLREAGAATGLYTVSVRSSGGVVSKRLVLVE